MFFFLLPLFALDHKVLFQILLTHKGSKHPVMLASAASEKDGSLNKNVSSRAEILVRKCINKYSN